MAKSSKRNSRKRSVGKKLLIACEGEKTEPIYFKAIRQELHLSKDQVIVLSPEGTDPLSIVREVCAEKQYLRRERNWVDQKDSAWAVFDGDEHIENNRDNWNQAIQKALSQNINLAITNPSIEFWYLIHFQDYSAYISRVEAKERLKQNIPIYDKDKCYYKEKLKVRTQDAIDNANKLDNLAKQNKLSEYANPCCSGISQLVEMMLKLGN